MSSHKINFSIISNRVIDISHECAIRQTAVFVSSLSWFGGKQFFSSMLCFFIGRMVFLESALSFFSVSFAIGLLCLTLLLI
jgi:hypothetical protein